MLNSLYLRFLRTSWNGLTPGDSSNGFDQINVTGNIAYGGILDVIVDLTRVSISEIINLAFINFGGTASGNFSQIRFWQDADKTVALQGLSLGFGTHDLVITSIPEPSSVLLLVFSFIAFAAYIRKMSVK